MKFFLPLFLLFLPAALQAQFKPFRFVFISDTHIGSPDGAAEEDLRRTVRQINTLDDIAFVVLTGDITELGTNEEIALARKILDSLRVKWYIIPGNHDTGWSESGGVMFTRIFGYDKFSFEYAGIRFLGCASGPYVRMGDGHVPRDAVNWLDEELNTLQKDQPVIFLNHYPIDNSLDNWYEITSRLHRVNTWAILCGHGHTNKAMNFEDIPGVMGRSNLRAKAPVGGYNLVEVTADSLLFTELRPGTDFHKRWTAVAIQKRIYAGEDQYNRPAYTINDSFPRVKETWRFADEANIISTPAVSPSLVMAGNQNGRFTALSLRSGKPVWTYQTGGAIFSSPAMSGSNVIFGSGDGQVYCLRQKDGKKVWSFSTGASVLGCPLVKGDTVFIGGSDHHFYALSASSGKPYWAFEGTNGPVVSTPVYAAGQVIFGAWDRNLYALNSATGKLNWTWNNGSTVRNYSPAACIPVVSGETVFVVAPDRYISAIDLHTGKTQWRNNDAAVRESLGISANGQWIYGKTMQDTVVAYRASAEKQQAAWKMHCGFGYEHVPSMLIEKDGLLYFGTKNGVVYCIDPGKQKIVWARKVDNSMVNTVRVLSGNRVVLSTMDGKLVLLEYR